MAINEVWKDIPGYEGLYQASTLGNIKSLKGGRWETGIERIFNPGRDKDGYLQTILSDGNRKSHKIHRLIAITFLKEVYNKNIINHKNGIKDDNRKENLEWCTQKENIQHSWRLGLSKPNTEKKVTQYDLFGNKIRSYISITKASDLTGVNRRSINNCLKGWSNTAGKFYWNYS